MALLIILRIGRETYIETNTQVLIVQGRDKMVPYYRRQLHILIYLKFVGSHPIQAIVD